jgi:hypothetical protein
MTTSPKQKARPPAGLSVRSATLMAGRTSGGRTSSGRATATTAGSGVDVGAAAATLRHRGRCAWHLRLCVHRRATDTADIRLRAGR